MDFMDKSKAKLLKKGKYQSPIYDTASIHLWFYIYFLVLITSLVECKFLEILREFVDLQRC